MNSINLVVVGTFPFPYGMASTKRVQHVIDGLNNYQDFNIRVIILRQSSASNKPIGVFRGTPYETAMTDLIRLKFVFLAPLFLLKAKSAIRRALAHESSNILYVYGPPTFDNVMVIRYAQRLGFKIIFDIVEDDETGSRISSSFYHRIKNFYTRRMVRQLPKLANGLIVISSHLKKKLSNVAGTRPIPIHLHPITIDFSNFKTPPVKIDGDGEISLFYAGSFGVKDGVNNLLDAFETLAARYPFLRLIMTGRGSKEVMKPILNRIADSPYSARIVYKGYLDDASYYSILQQVDIPCMTRIDLAYAHAGFPFKLGEFLATGKPVIASRVSDVEYYLIDKHNALLVRPGITDDIVQAVEYIIQNPGESNNIGKCGKECAKRSFDLCSQAFALRSFLLARVNIENEHIPNE